MALLTSSLAATARTSAEPSDLARSGAAGTFDESFEHGLTGGPAAAFLCARHAPVRARTAPVSNGLNAVRGEHG
jgi:hypothetical protein